jgi:hypothetical protein
MPTDIQLPAYPISGKGTVLQLENQRKKYRAAIESLEREIARSEDAFAKSFVDVDQRTRTRERIAALSKTARKTRLI